MMAEETMGQRLRLLRLAAGLRARDVAIDVGCRETQIYNWESGPEQPRPETIAALARALGTTADWLITGDHPQTAARP